MANYILLYVSELWLLNEYRYVTIMIIVYICLYVPYLLNDWACLNETQSNIQWVLTCICFKKQISYKGLLIFIYIMFISWLPCQCGVNCLFAFLLHAYICCLYVAFQSSNSLKAELSPFYLKHAGCVGRCIVTGTDKVMKNSPGRLDWLMAACVIYE